LWNVYLYRMAKDDSASKIVVENVNHPGLTQDEIRRAVLPFLSEEVFPGGEKVGWWAKSVQLDLEAKRIVVRDPTAKPLRWTRA